MKVETRLTDELIARYETSGHWGPETFYSVLAARAASHPDRVAIVDRGRRITYGELKTRVDRVAAGFKALGIGSGDVVTIQLPNWVEFAYVFFALERLGAVANQIGPDFRSREVDYILRFSESRAFVCPASFKSFDYVKMISELRPGLLDLKAVCVLGRAASDGGATPGLVSLDALLESTAAVPPPGAGQGANDVMRMAFTSGTTGNPKGVIHSHNTTLSTCRTLNADMRVTPDEVFLIYLPLGLNWGYLTLVQAVMAGARAVLLDQFSARVALELIQRERVTYIPTAPASIIAMLNEPDLERFDLASLRVIITGGASCPIETIREFRARMHGHLIELYGMLETGFHTYTRLDDDPEAVTGTVGTVSSGLGRDRGPGAVGPPRLSQEPDGERRALHRRRLVPHGRPRAVRFGRQREDRRAAQGDDQPRRQEVLPEGDRGNSLHAPENLTRRHRRRARPEAGRAQLPLRDPPRRSDPHPGRGGWLSAGWRRDLQAAGDDRGLR